MSARSFGRQKLLRRRRLQEEFLQRFTIMQFLATREVNESLAKFILSLASFRLLVSFSTVPFLPNQGKRITVEDKTKLLNLAKEKQVRDILTY